MMKKIKRIEPYIYLLPALIYFAIFSFYPFIKTIFLTFFTVDANGEVRSFAGISNYADVLTDELFIKSIANTIIYVLLASPVAILIALILALLANKKTRTSGIYETMFSLTMAMSMSVAAMIFKIMYNPYIGIINKLLGSKINWLNDSSYAMVSLSFISVWMNIGFNFLFLLAAVRNVPGELLESSDIDGAGFVKKVIKVIIPLISPTVFFLICTSLAKNIIMSGLPIILTEGGPEGSTTTMIYYMYKQAFGNMNYNRAYAAAVITFIFTLICMIISFSFEKKGVHYS
ncbi:sugar ABC transporter permease [Lachnospiraceae bacterium 29-91]